MQLPFPPFYRVAMIFLTILLLFLLLSLNLSLSVNGCPSHCGPTPIPYPFGIATGCSLPGFNLSCLHNQPFLLPNLLILDITNGGLRVDSTPFAAFDCASGSRNLSHIALPDPGPFTVSASANRLVALGCDTVAVASGSDRRSSGGCISLCTPAGRGGLCEAALPEGERRIGFGVGNMFGYRNTSGLGRDCSYAFVVEKERGAEELRGVIGGKEVTVAMWLDWEVGGDMCLQCGENARCVESSNRSGYLCYCIDGFDGNPYMNGSNGCQDIDECRDPETSPCIRQAHCRNKVPGYKCECPFGTTGDGTKQGSGCRRIFPIVEAVLGAIFGILLVLLGGIWLYFSAKRRSAMELREHYFRQNGGLLLKQQVLSREGSNSCARIFSSEELEKATDGYNSTRVVGAGGYGTVYKGVLEDGTIVAVKRSRVIDQAQIDLFINELVILTQINHRNVVKLLGCCLETEVPMLVYEFIPNGALYDHIHGPIGRISWRDRMRIAIETAEALAYLHSAATMPIFHRDVKSSNILLDDNYTAKVSDFGISRLVPLDQTQVPTLVQGTFGYLDPEYLQTSQLTAKSDVYSFGVVLVELLTGQKPVSFERPREDSNVAMFFLSSLKSKELGEFIDKDVMREGSIDELKGVAELARKCLLLRGDKRPSMKEVARELAIFASFRSEIEAEEMGMSTTFQAQDSFQEGLSVTADLAR